MCPTYWHFLDNKKESEYSSKEVDDPHLQFRYYLLKLQKGQAPVFTNIYPLIIFLEISFILAGNSTHSPFPLPHTQLHWFSKQP